MNSEIRFWFFATMTACFTGLSISCGIRAVMAYFSDKRRISIFFSTFCILFLSGAILGVTWFFWIMGKQYPETLSAVLNEAGFIQWVIGVFITSIFSIIFPRAIGLSAIFLVIVFSIIYGTTASGFIPVVPGSDIATFLPVSVAPSETIGEFSLIRENDPVPALQISLKTDKAYLKIECLELGGFAKALYGKFRYRIKGFYGTADKELYIFPGSLILPDIARKPGEDFNLPWLNSSYKSFEMIDFTQFTMIKYSLDKTLNPVSDF